MSEPLEWLRFDGTIETARAILRWSGGRCRIVPVAEGRRICIDTDRGRVRNGGAVVRIPGGLFVDIKELERGDTLTPRPPRPPVLRVVEATGDGD